MSARDDYQYGERGAQHYTMCDEIDRLRAEVETWVLQADLQRESYMAADARAREAHAQLADLARLALHGSRRDVEMYVHRLAYRYRKSSLGDALSTYDVVPGVSLRDES